MPYLQRTIQAGPATLVEKYYSSRYGRKGLPRRGNQHPTCEAVQRVNEARAVRKLWTLLLENFQEGDLFLLLTYRKEERPNPEEAKKRMEQFLRKLRKLYREAGEELRYIWVTEYKSAAIHHHLVLNRMDPNKISQLWPHGMARWENLYADGQFFGLAQYLVKETRKSFRERGGKRWNGSRTLRQPREQVKVMKAERWQKEPRVPKGMRLLGEVENGVSEITGWPCQRYVLLENPSPMGKRRAIPMRQ